MGCVANKNKSKGFEETKSLSMRSISLGQRMRTHVRKSSNLKLNQQGMPMIDNLLQASIEEEELANAILVNHVKSVREKTEIRSVLVNHFLFSALPLKSIDLILSNFNLYALESNSIVFRQNTIGKYFYIVDSGSVEVIINEISKSVIFKGGYFGEIALLHDTPRTATVKTSESTTLWVLSNEHFRVAVQAVNKCKYQENKKFLNGIPLFQILTNDQKEMMLGLCVYQEFEDNEKILLEGDPGEIFYIIKQGNVSCSIKGQELRILTVGDFFGEQALIYGTERTATITAVGKVSVLSLGADDLMRIYGNKLQDIIYKNSQRIALGRSRYLKYLTDPQMETCIKNMTVVNYNKGEAVFKIGSQRGDKVMLVVNGRLVSEEKVINVFDCVGDSDFKDSQKQFKRTWIADIDTDVATITRAELEKCLGDDINSIITNNELLHILRKVQLLRALPDDRLQSLIGVLRILNYSDKSTIIKQGDPGDSFFIVKSGQVEIFKDGIPLRTITKDDFFGERSIILHENRTATVIAKGDCSFWVLNKNDFLGIIDEGIRKQIMKRIDLQDDSITLDDLTLVKSIGHGMFGDVYLVYKTKNNAAYALKTVQR